MASGIGTLQTWFKPLLTQLVLLALSGGALASDDPPNFPKERCFKLLIGGRASSNAEELRRTADAPAPFVPKTEILISSPEKVGLGELKILSPMPGPWNLFALSDGRSVRVLNPEGNSMLKLEDLPHDSAGKIYGLRVDSDGQTIFGTSSVGGYYRWEVAAWDRKGKLIAHLSRYGNERILLEHDIRYTRSGRIFLLEKVERHPKRWPHPITSLVVRELGLSKRDMNGALAWFRENLFVRFKVPGFDPGVFIIGQQEIHETPDDFSLSSVRLEEVRRNGPPILTMVGDTGGIRAWNLDQPRAKPVLLRADTDAGGHVASFSGWDGLVAIRDSQNVFSILKLPPEPRELSNAKSESESESEAVVDLVPTPPEVDSFWLPQEYELFDTVFSPTNGILAIPSKQGLFIRNLKSHRTFFISTPVRPNGIAFSDTVPAGLYVLFDRGNGQLARISLRQFQ